MNKDQQLLTEAYEQVLNENWLDKKGKRDNEIPEGVDIVPNGTPVEMVYGKYKGLKGKIKASSWLPHMEKVSYDIILDNGKWIDMNTQFTFKVLGDQTHNA
jgi:hypothetical protein